MIVTCYSEKYLVQLFDTACFSSNGVSSEFRSFPGVNEIESIFTTTTSGTTTAFPLYDCHGNMVATVARSGAGFVTSNVRTYDVWGGVRTGATTGGPKGRYVANLGHVQDDESGLIYMRARYYEPESGRFISEDPARDGGNWFAYCNNKPNNMINKDGQSASALTVGGILGAVLYFLMQYFNGDDHDSDRIMKFIVAAGCAMGLVALGTTIEGWVAQFANKMAALLRLDRMKVGPQPNQIYPSRFNVQVMFYTGYALALLFIMFELKEWANGE